MIDRLLLLSVAFLVNAFSSFAQIDTSFYDRLIGVGDRDVFMLNADGISVLCEIKAGVFEKTNMKYVFKNIGFKEEDIATDSLLKYPNFYRSEKIEIDGGLEERRVTYFVKGEGVKIHAFQFYYQTSSIDTHQSNKLFEYNVIELCISNSFPTRLIKKATDKVINFNGRMISKSEVSYVFLNHIEIDNSRAITWSIHKDMNSANNSNDFEIKNLKVKHLDQMILDTVVNVRFEGKKMKARKLEFLPSGFISHLVPQAYGKTVSLYFIIVPSNNNYLQCIIGRAHHESTLLSMSSPLFDSIFMEY